MSKRNTPAPPKSAAKPKVKSSPAATKSAKPLRPGKSEASKQTSPARAKPIAGKQAGKAKKKPVAAAVRPERSGNVVELRAQTQVLPSPASAAVTPVPQQSARNKEKEIAAAPPTAKVPVRIFQIFYDDWHGDLLDSDFTPYDNRGVQSELFEFDVFEKLAQSPLTKDAEYWGALSWRFSEKTGMSGKELLATVAAKPGFDLYYCNPFPENEGLYQNTWVQGEPSHPAFLDLVTAFFEAAGLPVERLSSIQPSASFSAANFLVGNAAFWEAYLLYVRRALGNAERKMPANMRALLHSTMADQHSFHFGATYVPFIIERLVSTFLATEGSELKAFKFALPAREKALNVHQRTLREMKDVAHRTKSNWLAAAWINYRSLYLMQTNGREWCQKYLRKITPTSLKFG